MGLLGYLARAYLYNRMMRGARGRRRAGRRYGYGPRRRHRGGFFGPFPFPSYSTRTRGGSRVSIGGCCLPIPLAMVVATGTAVSRLVRR